MKICKVKIIKTRIDGGNKTSFGYPVGYDSSIVSPVIYQDEGNDIEYCLAHVPDDFTFTDDMTEVIIDDVAAIVDNWVDNNKDLVLSRANAIEISQEEVDKVDAEIARIKEVRKGFFGL